jgi:polyisoprenyl-phosphate glycosyltransferase
LISVIVPVYNEQDSVEITINSICKALDGFIDYEIIAVDDGSTDDSMKILRNCGVPNLKAIHHVENLGYGKSLFDGINEAAGNDIAIIDSDGSYNPEDFKRLIEFYPQYDMVVGARTGNEYKRGILKRTARWFFNYLAEYASGRGVPDINSGLRVFKKDIVMQFKESLCTGFSFTTTITLVFMMNHYFVKYVPVEYRKRRGKSKVNHVKDTLRAGQIIIQNILYYNPTKLFLLFAVVNTGFGIFLEILNHLTIKSTMVSIVAGLCAASFLPLFCLGLIADQIRRLSISKDWHN